jgi:deoxycytidine triphosphate deaminase
MAQGVSRFADSDSEAQIRYDRYRDVDPFPGIAPALLNSADIADYVAATGLIYPFIEDDDHLKPASYEVALQGPYVYWDDQGQEQADILASDEVLRLKPNSITFVTLSPMFRVPNYIALRFNLRITNIYRGLLLGTGPLVDPGYVGPLCVPLHNLTTSTYTFVGGEGLIWMEFTKISKHRTQVRPAGWNAPALSRQGKLFTLPSRKSGAGLSLRTYLQKASNDPIRSSIPEAALDATLLSKQSARDAEESRQYVDELRRLAQRFGALAAAGLLIGLSTLVFMTFQIANGVSRQVDTLSGQVAALQAGRTEGSSAAAVAQLKGAVATWRASVSDDLSDLVYWLGAISVGLVILAIVWFLRNKKAPSRSGQASERLLASVPAATSQDLTPNAEVTKREIRQELESSRQTFPR